MPTILHTDVAEWREQARRWHRRRPGRDAVALGVEERRGSYKARCAFYLAALDKGVGALIPGFAACRACGQPTHSWCEGCYARVQQTPALAFAAICQPCDGEQWVCDLCTRSGITYAQGREAYNATRSEIQVQEEETQADQTVEVTGRG